MNSPCGASVIQIMHYKCYCTITGNVFRSYHFLLGMTDIPLLNELTLQITEYLPSVIN